MKKELVQAFSPYTKPYGLYINANGITHDCERSASVRRGALGVLILAVTVAYGYLSIPSAAEREEQMPPPTTITTTTTTIPLV